MAEMDPTAKYHRTLDLRGNPYIEDLPGLTAYTFRGQTFIPIKYDNVKGRDFKKYATAWEILHSKVPFGEGSGTVWPVVEDDVGVVVGHYGWFDSDEIFVPANLGGEVKVVEVPVRGTWGLPRAVEIVKKHLSLKDYLEVGADVIADKYHKYYLNRGYLNWFQPQQSFAVMTDIEGHVLLVLSSRDTDGIEPVWYSPLDLIAVVKVVAGLAAAGIALALRTYVRRRAVRALTSGVEARLRNTAVDLLGKNPIRTAEVLTKPRTYRHTLTGGIPGVNYARIEMEGSMRLSTGVDAHYGEGVYAWHAGQSGVGTYIDVEVPAGMGVETLKVGGQSWVRIVPPGGDVLPVKIVGTNVPAQQIDFGRKMVKPD